MNYVDLKDLQLLVRYVRFDIEAVKKQLEKDVDERYMDILQKRVKTLEPVIERIESQLTNIKLTIM